MDMSLEQNISIYSIKNIIIVAKEIQWPVSKQKHNRHQFGSLGPRATYFRLHSLLAFIFKPIFFLSYTEFYSPKQDVIFKTELQI
jgi:hypothetical protein